MTKASPELRKEAGDTAMIGIKLLFARYNPFVSREQYNNIVKQLITHQRMTAEELFQTLEVMRWSKGYSQKFENTKKQVNSLFGEFPELSNHESFVTEYVKLKRKSWRLSE